jgi:hypothetical protein
MSITLKAFIEALNQTHIVDRGAVRIDNGLHIKGDVAFHRECWAAIRAHVEKQYGTDFPAPHIPANETQAPVPDQLVWRGRRVDLLRAGGPDLEPGFVDVWPVDVGFTRTVPAEQVFIGEAA